MNDPRFHFSRPIVILLSFMMFFVSLSIRSESLDEIQNKAEDGDSQAQLELAHAYQKDGLKKNTQQILYWYTRAAATGNNQAQYELGLWFEKQQPTPDLIQASVWYKIAAEHHYPQAEEAYSRVLELQFNQRRARQISAIQQLDLASDDSRIPQPISPPPEQYNAIRTDIIIIVTVLLFALLYTVVKRSRRQKESQHIYKLKSDTARLTQQLHQLSKKHNLQQKQMVKMHTQLQKEQQQGKESRLNTACALLGYSADNLPDDNALKLRYKKLCRVYHPDAGGSSSEMQRLNAAVKLISRYKKNS